MTATFATTAPRSLPTMRTGRPAGVVVVVPSRLATVPTTTVYVRRRIVVALVFLLVAVAVWFGAGTVLANRGGAPASTPTVRPAATYLVQPGDTMWSIAAALHGGEASASYVDALVELNGGADLVVGETIVLP